MSAATQRETYLRRGLRGEAIDYALILRGDPCAYCGRTADTVDHIQPTSTIVDHGWDNLTSACRSCNGEKSALDLVQFLRVRRKPGAPRTTFRDILRSAA